MKLKVKLIRFLKTAHRTKKSVHSIKCRSNNPFHLRHNYLRFVATFLTACSKKKKRSRFKLKFLVLLLRATQYTFMDKWE